MSADEDVPEGGGIQAWVIYLWGMQKRAREEIKTSMQCKSPIRHIAPGDKQGYTLGKTQLQFSVSKYPTSTSATHRRVHPSTVQRKHLSTVQPYRADA